jgi:hypothetical protein
MSRIVLDDDTIARLLEDPRPRDVCDEQGRVVGYFQPKLESEPETGEGGRQEASPQPADPTAEVLERIRRLEGE